MNTEFKFNMDLTKLKDRFDVDIMTKQFIDAFDKGIKKGYKELVDRMIDKLIENLSNYGLDSGNIIGSLDIKINDNGVSLIIDDGAEGYAMYVEFGTGVVGAKDSHPQVLSRGWRYDVNEHGELGWWYPTNIDDPNPTKYRSELGWYAWTKGQASRPFMYETWLWTSRSATQIISKNIKSELSKLERRMR